MAENETDYRITIRVPKNDYLAWKAEAKKNGTPISKFVRNCVYRAMGIVEKGQIMEALDDIKDRLELAPIKTQLEALRKEIGNSTRVLEGKRAEIARIEGNIIDPAEREKIVAFIKAAGETELQDIVKSTGMPIEHVYAALQLMSEIGTVTATSKRGHTLWSVKE